MSVEVRLGSGLDVEAEVGRLVADRVASRLFARDATLWGEAAEAEASIRLGWTDFEGRAAELVPEIERLRAELAEQGVDRVVLCGMGGSSLAPEVIASRAGAPLVVLDSTHPAQVRRALEGDLSRTVVVVSSKSGSTIETRSHRAAFEHAFREAGVDPADRIVVVTDPGSPLEASAREAGQRVFLADPEVGGRYSALTAFGLVPSGLAGVDLGSLVAEAVSVREALTSDDAQNPALRLAAAIAAGLPRRYALALASADDARWGLGEWIEQLIAESTGKQGRGVLPVVLPEGAQPTSERELLVSLSARPLDPASADALAVGAPLGAQFVLWEAATAVLGRLMGIDPFDQPDVESAKIAAREVLGSGETPSADAEPAPDVETLVERLRKALPEGGYVALQAYVDREGDAVPALEALRTRLAEALGAPVTLGFGPRFLHSTGQLHKGGPRVGVFVQFFDESAPGDLPIPDSDSTFGTLIVAQAAGDRRVLEIAGRPVIAVSGVPAR